MKSNILFIPLLIVITFGCIDPIDDNLNNPQINLGEALSTAQITSGECISSFYNLVGGFWSQYWTQSNTANRYSYIEDYEISQNSWISHQHDVNWENLYSIVLFYNKLSIEEAATLQKWNYFLMNTVHYAYVYQLLADCYGDIPYTEALQGISENQIVYPHYDHGNIVYLDLLSKIDTALKKVENWKNNDPIKNDLLFQGDIDKWKRFANTLKLKMYLRVSEFNAELAQEGIQKMYNNNVPFLETDAKLDIYISWDNMPNPLYYWDRVYYSTSTNLRISNTLALYFIQNNDARIQSIIDKNWEKDTITNYGMPQGGYNISNTYLPSNQIDVFKINANQPVYFISEVESYLLQAEAIARGWGAGNDQALYNSAISKDFSRKGLEDQELTLIGVGGIYEYPTNGSIEEKLKAIIMAKWAALSEYQGIEAFFETNRTGIPEVSSVPSWINNSFNPEYLGGQLTYSLSGKTNGLFPKRFIYPDIELKNNKNFPGQSQVTDKVWWDIK
ncbi:MAG: SusD/RagB family nutrient-binding outer membrane lipoprotein [Salinivirgaceae bacterium]|nr:SusD/RagB family nutrient-binding outer membrane lipoprotein [Salinivirgaceae bacterium]